MLCKREYSDPSILSLRTDILSILNFLQKVFHVMHSTFCKFVELILVTLELQSAASISTTPFAEPKIPWNSSVPLGVSCSNGSTPITLFLPNSE